MPWTLYRYITKETLKLLAISSLVLMVVISLAAGIKPLSEGLIGITAMLKFLAYTSPTMLQFALPFSGAFAATLFYGRLVADNELLACSASGLSYRSILLPVMVLGLAMMIGLYQLSNTLVPSYNQAAAAMVEEDLIHAVANQLEKGRVFRFGRITLYADRAQERAPTQREVQAALAGGMPTAPFRILLLRGVAVRQTNDDQSIRREGTAESADLLLYHPPASLADSSNPNPGDLKQNPSGHRTDPADGTRAKGDGGGRGGRGEGGGTVGQLHLKNIVLHDPQQGQLASIRQLTYTHVLESPLRDRPQFLSGQALRDLGRHPERFDRVANQRDRLAQALANRDLLHQFRLALTQGDRIVRLSSGSEMASEGSVGSGAGAGGELYGIQAGQVESTPDGQLKLLTAAGRPVRIELIRDGRKVRVYEAAYALATAQGQAGSDDPRLSIELFDARVLDVRGLAAGAEHQSLKLLPMNWPTALSARYRQASVRDLLGAAKYLWGEGKHEPQVQQAAAMLQSEIDSVIRSVLAQMHQRAAAAVTCMLVLVLGAVFSMLMRGQSPLSVYFWVFLATLSAVIINQTGQILCGYLQYPVLLGAAVIWSGNLWLTGAIGLTYYRLSRH